MYFSTISGFWCRYEKTVPRTASRRMKFSYDLRLQSLTDPELNLLKKRTSQVYFSSSVLFNLTISCTNRCIVINSTSFPEALHCSFNPQSERDIINLIARATGRSSSSSSMGGSRSQKIANVGLRFFRRHHESLGCLCDNHWSCVFVARGIGVGLSEFASSKTSTKLINRVASSPSGLKQ